LQWNCADARFRVWHELNSFGHSKVQRKLVDTLPGDILVKGEPRGGWAGACYVVTAYPASTHAAAESEPGPQICVGATHKTVIVKANASRGYTKEYSILYSDNQQHVQTYPARGGSDLQIGGTFDSTNQSQVNIFQRAAYAFDLSSIGGNNVFGGTFAYDLGPGQPGNCGELFQAPDGWKSATWIAPRGWTKYGRNPPYGFPLAGVFTKSGSTVSQPIDALVQKWNRAKPLALLITEGFGIGPAESTQSGVVPYSFTCQAVVIKPRLMLEVGITV
jgi:hypothetical protein